MGKASINAFIQLFGILGIIGSLIFVGLEMRQSQRIAIAGQQQSRAEIEACHCSLQGYACKGQGFG